MSFSTEYQIATANQTTPGGGSDAVFSFAQRVNADIATNLNNLTQTEVPMDGAMATNQTGYAINGNGIQLIGPDAFVRCSFSLHLTSLAARTNLIVRLALNGTLFGPVAASGYIRAGTGHNESSLTVCAWTKMATNDIITVSTLREANAGTVTMAAAGTSQLLLERIVNV